MTIQSLQNTTPTVQSLRAQSINRAPAPQPAPAATVSVDAQALLSRMAQLLDTMHVTYGQSADPQPSHLDVRA